MFSFCSFQGGKRGEDRRQDTWAFPSSTASKAKFTLCFVYIQNVPKKWLSDCYLTGQIIIFWTSMREYCKNNHLTRRWPIKQHFESHFRTPCSYTDTTQESSDLWITFPFCGKKKVIWWQFVKFPLGNNDKQEGRKNRWTLGSWHDPFETGRKKDKKGGVEFLGCGLAAVYLDTRTFASNRTTNPKTSMCLRISSTF